MTQLQFYAHPQKKNPALELLHRAIKKHGKHKLSQHFNEFAIDAYTLTDDEQSKVIAIDYDNTVTADPEFFKQLIDKYRQKNWEPVICTLREGSKEDIDAIRALLYDTDIKIYTSNGHRKQQFLLSLGIKVNLWIDDFFPSICHCDCPLLTNNGIKL